MAGILHPGAQEPELREIANDPKLIRRLFERLKREGPVEACYEAGVSDRPPIACGSVPCRNNPRLCDTAGRSFHMV